PFMESLDFPDLGLLSAQRGLSVSALQALTLFNNDFVLHHSRVLAERIGQLEAPASADSLSLQVRRACRLVWLREPSATELDALRRHAKRHGMASLCRVLFNSNEFLFVE
ncbi:MAG: DUF1553 domain-containing protein, partial [Planctomycetales bacterium]|nr:DUF1553 domain-containing protein [Planctomycetales bacterium]